MRVLLTGASGFISAHILASLLDHGHDVVATVRSADKAAKIEKHYSHLPTGRLEFAIVADVSSPDAFNEAVKWDPPLDAVIHTASPFHFNIEDPKDFLDPAVKGTIGLLKAIKRGAPTIKRVILTSSFAAIIDVGRPNNGAGHIYSEKDWNPVTMEEVLADPTNAYRAYRASKTFSEKAAWDFMEEEKPGFTLTTMCPPFVFGPTVFPLTDAKSLNTSNHLTRDFLRGNFKDKIPETGDFIWVDDLALGHVRAMEISNAANKRFFITAGYFNNRQVAEAIRKHYPEYKEKLPTESTPGGGFPEDGMLGYDNRQTIDVLRIHFRSIETCIADSVASFKDIV
ncbi:NAD(P)-binding protein [Stipitochalara longipes BDJ]|nr:NAD(P)-binding protein [Stipitochalara longipes BDJ]